MPIISHGNLKCLSVLYLFNLSQPTYFKKITLKIKIKAWSNRKLKGDCNFNKKCKSCNFLAFMSILNINIKVNTAKNNILHYLWPVHSTSLRTLSYFNQFKKFIIDLRKWKKVAKNWWKFKISDFLFVSHFISKFK